MKPEGSGGTFMNFPSHVVTLGVLRCATTNRAHPAMDGLQWLVQPKGLGCCRVFCFHGSILSWIPTISRCSTTLPALPVRVYCFIAISFAGCQELKVQEIIVHRSACCAGKAYDI